MTTLSMFRCHPLQRTMKILKKYHLAGFITFLVLLVLWSIVSYGGMVNRQFLPTPSEVVTSFIGLITSGSYFADIAISVQRVLIGFVISVVVAVPVGMLMGTVPTARIFIEPFVSFMRYLPAAAFVPVFILFLGIGESAKIAVIIIGCIFYLTVMVMDVAKQVDLALIEVSQTMGASSWQMFRKVIFPASFPGIVDAMRTTFGAAWTYLVVAEITGASQGLGFLIMRSARFLRAGDMYLGIVTIGVLGLLFDGLFGLFQRIKFSYLRK